MRQGNLTCSFDFHGVATLRIGPCEPCSYGAERFYTVNILAEDANGEATIIKFFTRRGEPPIEIIHNEP